MECDAVIHLRNGTYGLIEIKLGGDSLIEEGAKNLKDLASKIDTDKMREPAFMLVLCAKSSLCIQKKRRCLCRAGYLFETIEFWLTQQQMAELFQTSGTNVR